jgi:starch synthase
VRILMIASEVEPFAKTGGLADVLGSLPRALARRGHEVVVVMPRYRGVTAGERIALVPVQMGGQVVETSVFGVSASGVLTVFIDRPEYYDREFLYGGPEGDYADSPERFAFLAHATLAWMASTGRDYDIVHTHDWQAGVVPALLARGNPRAPHSGTVFTIHNLAYQGTFEASWLPRIGLGPEFLRVEAMEFWRRISFLKAGIQFSRVVTTVSPRYAAEIQTPEYGFGFDGLLRDRATDIVGILNGIDTERWDPSADPYLPRAFSAAALEGKAAAKRALLERFGMAVTDESLRRPLVGVVSRLVDQKGFDLVAGVAEEIPRLAASFVVLGSGEPAHEHLWRGLAAAHPERIGVSIGFDEGLAHLIEGGADIFLMPSRFEPCGLNQMYSLRYGTVPLVRATGGLADTVRPFDPKTGEGTGFVFEEYTPAALIATLRFALQTFEAPDVWRRIQLAGMREDYSWAASAARYEAVYERASRVP